MYTVYIKFILYFQLKQSFRSKLEHKQFKNLEDIDRKECLFPAILGEIYLKTFFK